MFSKYLFFCYTTFSRWIGFGTDFEMFDLRHESAKGTSRQASAAYACMTGQAIRTGSPLSHGGQATSISWRRVSGRKRSAPSKGPAWILFTSEADAGATIRDFPERVRTKTQLKESSKKSEKVLFRQDKPFALADLRS